MILRIEVEDGTFEVLQIKTLIETLKIEDTFSTLVFRGKGAIHIHSDGMVYGLCDTPGFVQFCESLDVSVSQDSAWDL